MNPLTFTLKIKPQFSLDVAELTPDKLAEKNRSQIKSLKLNYGKKKVPVAELFSITGNDSENIHIHRSNDKLVCVGQGIYVVCVYVVCVLYACICACGVCVCMCM